MKTKDKKLLDAFYKYINAYDTLFATVKQLVEDGADMNVKDEHGLTAFDHAINGNYLEIVNYLLSTNKVHIAGAGEEGWNKLHKAAFEGDLSHVKQLITTENFDAASRDKKGNTPLHWAVIGGHLPVVTYLVEHGKVNVDAMTNSNWTPLLEACRDGYFDIVKYLVEHGAAVNYHRRERIGTTPLHMALHNINIVQLLLKHGADVNAIGPVGRTPLHWALAWGADSATIKCLVEHGASLHMETNSGELPIDIALRHGRQDIVNYFKEVEKKKNKKGRD